jgi:flagellar hook assembly protein FlgD
MINIFTLTGRKIKEIKLSSSDLQNDFNRIYWDGKDEDGEVLANGVYLYKLISIKDNKSVTSINKLAIIR